MIETESADLLAQIRSLQAQDDEIPEGFKTAKQWAEEWNLSESHTMKLLREAKEAGLLTSQKFRVNKRQAMYYKKA